MPGPSRATAIRPRSRATRSRWNGRRSRASSRQFPEIDRAEFFDLATARKKIKSGQVGLIDELEMILNRK